MDGYEIVRMRAEHRPLVAELQRALWSTDVELNTRYFDWKYAADEARGEGGPFVYLALREGRAVGMRGFHEARLEAGVPARTVKALMAGDAVVAPAHRNRGLVARILDFACADLAARGYPYAMSIGGANRVNALGMMTLGWKSAGAVHPVGRVTEAVHATRRRRRGMKRLPLLWRFSESRWLAPPDQRRPFRHLDAAVAAPPLTVESRPRVEAMEELVGRLGHDGRIRYRRDGAYLDWRFRNPMSESRFLYWTEDRLEGYLVLSRRLSDLGAWERVYVADLEARDPAVRAALLGAAIRLGRFPELVTWSATLGDGEAGLLESTGFVPIDPEYTARGCPCILVRPLGRGPDGDWRLGGLRVLDMQSWDVRVLYSMRG